MEIIINPGSGPVAGASLDEARQNMDALIEDALGEGVTAEITHRPEREDGDGRFSFDVQHDGRTVEVEMPGLPLERVRYTGADGQNIWHFPRLYVDGSSWVWCFAVNSVVSVLKGEEDE